MIEQAEWQEVRRWIREFAKKAGLPLGEHEMERLEVADLGLGELELTGLQIVTLASTDWVGVKLLFLRPNQFFPQHRHPPSIKEGYPGKTEVLRGHYGQAYLYVPGPETKTPKVSPPPHRRRFCTVWNEVSLLPGQQHICPPNTWHWFQAGPAGAIVWSISSKATDAADQFSDPQVVRLSTARARLPELRPS
jgi:D-lyxose ketol-isomerase